MKDLQKICEEIIDLEDKISQISVKITRIKEQTLNIMKMMEVERNIE